MKKGISLVALVITIIVLIVLTAAVVLNIGGENSIIAKARLAVEADRIAKLEEQSVNWRMDIKAQLATGKVLDGTELTEELDKLKDQKILTEEEYNIITTSPTNELIIGDKVISFYIGEIAGTTPAQTYNITYADLTNVSAYGIGVESPDTTIQEGGTFEVLIQQIGDYCIMPQDVSVTMNGVELIINKSNLSLNNIIQEISGNPENAIFSFYIKIENVTGDIVINAPANIQF